MEPTFRIVTPTAVTSQPRRSKFREEFDMPCLRSISDHAVSPTAESQISISDLSESTDDSETMPFIPALSRSARSSGSSASWKSSTSNVVKKCARYPLKKIREGVAKLSSLKKNPET